MTTNTTLAGLLLAGLAAALVAPAPAHVAAGSASAHHLYTVRETEAAGRYVFRPARLAIHVGDTVRWVDLTEDGHNVVGVGPAAATIDRRAVNKAAYTLTFKKPGAYHYVCQVHPGMSGTVVVTT